MAVKQFTSEILTSSDTNTYLANSGLVYVSSTTVGSAVSSVTVSSAFSATYDSYKIIYAGGVMSGSNAITMTIGGVTTSYYGAVIFCNYNASAAQGLGTNNGANIPYAGGGDTSFAVVDIDVLNPFNTVSTLVQGPYQNNTAMGSMSYRLANTTSYTSFAFATSAGTMTGGTITVYGYRKA